MSFFLALVGGAAALQIPKTATAVVVGGLRARANKLDPVIKTDSISVNPGDEGFAPEQRRLNPEEVNLLDPHTWLQSLTPCGEQCGMKGGYCDHCGSGRLCCRMGEVGGGCDGTMGVPHSVIFTGGAYICVDMSDCWEACGKKSGECEACGGSAAASDRSEAAGQCCRLGYIGGSCDGTMGISERHTCIDYRTRGTPLDYQTDGDLNGAHCLESCGKSGECDACGAGGMCCRVGYVGGGCDGSMGISEYHTCVDSPWSCLHACRAELDSGGSLTGGPCEACGGGAACCQANGVPSDGCDGKHGSVSYHSCVCKDSEETSRGEADILRDALGDVLLPPTAHDGDVLLPPAADDRPSEYRVNPAFLLDAAADHEDEPAHVAATPVYEYLKDDGKCGLCPSNHTCDGLRAWPSNGGKFTTSLERAACLSRDSGSCEMCCPECARIGAASFEGGNITEQADVAHATEHGQCVCVEGSFESGVKNFFLTDKNDCLRIDAPSLLTHRRTGIDATLRA